MATPVMKIGDMSFELGEGFTDGYTNYISPPEILKAVTHPWNYLWHRGEFKPLRIQLELAVGVHTIIPTPDALKAVCGKFYKLALAPKPVGNAKPVKVPFSVGSWYKRNGYIKDLVINYKAPWSSEGMPMTATITFEFVLDFGEDPEKLPSSNTFSFIK